MRAKSMKKLFTFFSLLLLSACTTPERLVAPSVQPHDEWIAEVKAKREAARTEYLETNPDIPVSIRQAIETGWLTIGMTQEQLRASMGVPDQVNSHTTARGRTEQWVYKTPGIYAYFDERGVLTSWQDL